MRIYLFVLFLCILFYHRKFFSKTRLINEINPIKTFRGFPLVIFRTIGDKKVFQAVYDFCHKSWKDFNPDFTIVWYTNKDCDRFMEKHYPGEVLQAYKILRPGAYKADLWRLCVLNKFGGFYIDAYATPYVSLKNMLTGIDAPFISVLDSAFFGRGIHNGIIFSQRGHPFLKQGIDDIVENVKKRYYGKTPLDITGPNALSKTIRKLTGKDHVVGLNQGGLPYYLYDHHYGLNQNIYKGETKIISKYFSFTFYAIHKFFSKGYVKYWKNREVYSEDAEEEHVD